MAIDPTIALGIRPMESPIDSMGKAQSLQNMQTQGKMGQLGLQQAQTQMAQQQALNAAYADPANRNPDGSINYQSVQNSLAKAGAGSLIPGIAKTNMEMQQSKLNLDKSKFEDAQRRNSNMADHIQGLMADKALTPEKVKSVLDASLQAGDLDQQHYQQSLQTMPQTADPMALKAWLAQQATQVYATGAKLQQFLPQVKAETVGGQIVPVSTTQATGEVTAGKPLVVTPQDELGKAKQDLQNGLITQDEYNKREQKINHFAPNTTILMGGAGGPPGAIPDYSNPLKDPGEEAMAKAIAAKQQDPIKVSSRNYAYATRVNGRAASLGGGELPGSVGVAEQKAGELAFGPKGAQGQALQNIDTATGHLAHLQSLIGAMNNGDSRALNAASNWFTTQFGGAAPNNFDTVKSVAIPEVLKVAKGAGLINEQEERQLQTVADRAGSPAQLNGFISQFQHIMGSRAEALDPVYQRYFPGHRIGERLRPSTVDMFKGIGLDLTAKPDQKGAASPTNPGGQPATQVNPANGKTYYLHSDGKYYLTQAQ